MVYWGEYINQVKSFSSRAHIGICQNAPRPFNWKCENKYTKLLTNLYPFNALVHKNILGLKRIGKLNFKALGNYNGYLMINWSLRNLKITLNPLTSKTIEIPLTPKTPFGDATLGGYCEVNKCDKIFIIFNDTRSRIDLNWRLIILI